jgi:hypothetical protein
MEQDLRQNEEGRRTAEKRVDELENENRRMRDRLAGVFASENNIWVLAEAFADYATANEVCEGLKYTLPTRVQFEEFLNGPYASLPESQRVQKAEEFHVLNETLELEKGFVLCRKSPKIGG